MIIKILETLHEDADQSNDTQDEAEQLAAHLCKFESIFMCLFWDDIIERVDKVDLILQAEGRCLKAVVDSMKSLLKYFKSIRSNFDHYENKACLVFSKLFDDVESPVYHCEANPIVILVRSISQKLIEMTLRSTISHLEKNFVHKLS